MFIVHCARDDPRAARVVEMYQRHKDSRANPARCVVCGETGKPDDHGVWLTTAYVDADPDSPLYRFNFIDVHKEHLQDWALLPEYLEEIERRTQAGTWEREAWYSRSGAP